MPATISARRTRRIEVARGDMRLPAPALRRLGIRHAPHTRDPVGVRLGDEHDLVAAGRDQVPDDVQVLAGEVLVDEQEFHAAALPVADAMEPAIGLGSR